MPNYKLVQTEDQSYTVYNPELNSHYHSLHGAIGESLYVYIQNSNLESKLKTQNKVSILEIGFGTGLNFLLTLNIAINYPNCHVQYISFEPYPLPYDIINQYYENLDLSIINLSVEQIRSIKDIFLDKPLKTKIIPNVTSKIIWEAWDPQSQLNTVDIIYYDAFGPYTTPNLWSEVALISIISKLNSNGYFVTFSINGNTRRILKKHQIKFITPRGYGRKRQMLVVWKN